MTRKTNRRTGFTLVEMLLVITIIGILTALGLAVLRGAEEDALQARTEAQINRISKVLNAKLEENIYRILPARLDPNDDPTYADPAIINDFRRQAMAELMLVEFPSDLDHVDSANFPRNSMGGLPPLTYDWGNDFPVPQMLLRYEAYFGAGSPTPANEQAECLYAILSLNYGDDGNVLIEILRKSEIRDTDEDGFNEVVDAYGDPLEFRLVDEAGIAIDPTLPVEPQQYQFQITSVNLKDAL